MSTWILLRGLTREQGHWGTFPALLRVALGPASGSSIVPIDLPGNGVLNALQSPTHIASTMQPSSGRKTMA